MSSATATRSVDPAAQFLDGNHINIVVRIEDNQIVESYASLKGVRIHVIQGDDDRSWQDSNAVFSTEVNTDQ